MNKIIIEITNDHQPYKILDDGNPVPLTHASGSTSMGNGNVFCVVKENLSIESINSTIKTWFIQGFVDYSPKLLTKDPTAASNVFIPIKRIVEIHVIE